MPDPLIPLAQDWLPKLLRAGAKIWTERRAELEKIFNEFGDVELLAKSYIEPDCQPYNPADRTEDEPLTTWLPRKAIRERINEFLKAEFLERDGRNTLFVLSDAGMGKSSLLMMLKLTHLLEFWPNRLDFRLLKLGPETLDEIGGLENHKHTVLLLDALDEDRQAWGRIEERITELLHATASFRQVVVTCRTQFFPEGGRVPLDRPGKVELAGFVCNLLFLSPFSNEQVDRYLRKVYPGSLIDRLRKWLTRQDNQQLDRARNLVLPMQSLRMRPMLLAYVKDLMEADLSGGSEYSVYHALVDHWLLREERKPGTTVTREQLWEACRILAMRLQASGERSLVATELEALVERNQVIQHLTALDLGGRSLLNRNSDGDYRFAHYSIQEFLVAHTVLTGGPSPAEPPLRVTDQILNFLFSWVTDAPAENVLAVLVPEPERGSVHQLLEPGGSWEQRSELYLRLPAIVDEPLRVLALFDYLRRRTRNGNDLFFLDQAVGEVAARWPDCRESAAQLRARLYDHIPPPPEELFRWVETSSDGRVSLWREIPAGSFSMGEEPGPRLEVAVESPFRFGAVTVTNTQYAAFDPLHQSHFKGKSHPVDSVTWYEAMSFCRWLSASFVWARGARLPTEEEWEYACRAGTSTPFWSGHKEADLARVGWYRGNSGTKTHRVGDKPANPWGLYDVHGNVWEWTLSPSAGSHQSREDGIKVGPSAIDPADYAATRGEGRVFRGGSFWGGAQVARSAFRLLEDPEVVNGDLGFRVLLPSPEDPRS